MIRVVLIASAIVLITVVVPPPSFAQPSQPLYVVDTPTAGILMGGSYLIRGRTGPSSSFLADARIGLFSRLQIGVSYGVQGLFEHGTPQANDLPGVNARVRIIDEAGFPAVALGFDSQGQGVYHDAQERYDRKSLGFYAVLSKNYNLIVGELSLHGGANVSMERKDDDDVNVFAGLDWLLLGRISLLLDADAGWNDNSDASFGAGGPYLDAGARWYLGEAFVLSLYFRDLGGNFTPNRSVGREFELAMVRFF